MKKKMVATLIISLMLLPLLGLAGCGQQAEGNVVKIGIAQPLTGSCANDGQMSRDGCILALEHAKNRSELAKYKIELVTEDDKSDPKDAAAIANKFAGDNKVIAVIGNYNSSCTLAAASILTKAGIPQIATGSSSPKITGFSKYLFRTQPTDAAVGADIVKWAAELGIKKAAVVYENSDFGKGLEQIYRNLWPQTGGEIVADESYLPGTNDFTSILTKVKSAGAQAVLMGSLYNEAALMAKQAKQVGLNATFFGDSSQHTNALLDLGKPYVEGWHVVGCMDPTSQDPVVVKFFNDFQQKFGHPPNTFAAQAYDAMLLVLEGLAKYGPDRAKIQDFLFNVKEFPGITGKLSFKDGDVQKNFFRFVVKDGNFVRVEK